MSRLLPAMVVACAAGGAWTILRLFDASAAHVDPAHLSWRWVAVATSAMLGFVLLYAHASAALLRAVSGAPVSHGRAVRFFVLMWPGRYVPSGLPYYGGRIAAAPSIGVPRAAMTAALLYESLLAIAGAGTTCLLLVLVVLQGRLPGLLWLSVAAAGFALAGLSLHPAVIRAALRPMAKRSTRFAALQAHVLPGARAAQLVVIYATASLLAGVALWACLHALGAQVSFAVSCVAFNVAGIAGMLAVPLPSGMGVREAAVVALLAGVASPSEALAAALLARIAGVVSDLVPFTLVVIWHGIRRFTPAATPAAATRRVTEAG